jgi:hypothetical protein
VCPARHKELKEVGVAAQCQNACLAYVSTYRKIKFKKREEREASK